MKNNLFRKEALASAQRTFDTRENLYSLPLNMKLIAFLLALCFALFAVWMFFGNLTQTLQADGIIYSKNGQHHMYAPSGGIVSDVLVQTGDRVQEGDVIAVIYNPDALPNAEQTEFGRYVVRTTQGGVITEVCTEGMGIDTGDLIASMVALSSSNDDRVVYAFIPAGEANSIKLGMTAQVSLQFAPREKYGYIEGYVSDIEDYTVQGERLSQSFGQTVNNIVDADSTYHIVQITLLPDNESPNGLRCSNTQGASLSIQVGAGCDVDIVYGIKRPYAWLVDGR